MFVGLGRWNRGIRAPSNRHARLVFDRVYSYIGRRRRRESEVYGGSTEHSRPSYENVREDRRNYVRTIRLRRPAPMEPLEVRISMPARMEWDVDVTWSGGDRDDVEVESVYEEEVGAECSEREG